MAQFIQLMTTFVGGFVIAFSRGWLLTLVMLSSIPPLVLCGSMLGLIITKASSRAQAAYSIAASIVEQTIGSVRTVCTLTKKRTPYFFLFDIAEEYINDFHLSNAGCIIHRGEASYR